MRRPASTRRSCGRNCPTRCMVKRRTGMPKRRTTLGGCSICGLASRRIWPRARSSTGFAARLSTRCGRCRTCVSVTCWWDRSPTGKPVTTGRSRERANIVLRSAVSICAVDRLTRAATSRVCAGTMRREFWRPTWDSNGGGTRRRSRAPCSPSNRSARKDRPMDSHHHLSYIESVGVFYTREELVRARAEWKALGKTVVFTNGCYDLLHPGHIRLLEKARSLGDALILALNSDASVQRLKGPSRPLISERDRAEVALGLEAVDAVTLFDEDTPRELIAAVLPDVLVKGADWAHWIAGREEVEAAGGKVMALSLEPGYSSTGIVEAVLTRKL